MATAGRVAIVPRGEYQSGITYIKLDYVTYNNSAYICLKDCVNIVPTNTTYWMLSTTGASTITDTSNLTTTFTQASTRANVKSGETQSTLFGKIMKWFADLKNVAFSGSYNDLSDTPDIDALSTKLDDCFQSASDGKAKVASAITGKGVTTASDATYETMATNISNIKTDPNLQSKTASLKTSSQTIKADSGYDGLSQVTVPAVTGTAAVGNVLSGKTFSSATAGIAKTGTMANKGSTTVTTTTTSSDDDYTYLGIPSAGYYNTDSKVRILTNSLNRSMTFHLKTTRNTGGSDFSGKADTEITFSNHAFTKLIVTSDNTYTNFFTLKVNKAEVAFNETIDITNFDEITINFVDNGTYFSEIIGDFTVTLE